MKIYLLVGNVFVISGLTLAVKIGILPPEQTGFGVVGSIGGFMAAKAE